jgi:CheY-like chemotaxis protein
MIEEELGALDILLVEDSDEDAELSMVVQRVADGEQALDVMFGRGAYAHRGAQRPRVVLLDLKLPKVDGIAVLRAIRENPETARTPVVVLTSSAENSDLKECYRHGVNSYIVKPVGFAGFLQAVEQLGLYWAVLNRPPQP